MSKRARSTRGHSSSSQGVSIEEKFKGSGYSRVVCTKCTTMLLLDATFTPGTSSIGISSPTKVLLKPSSSPSTKTLSPAPNGYDPNHLGVRFRSGGGKKDISILKLGWRISLYSKRQSRESATLSRSFTALAIRDPRVKLANRCIATTNAGRKESTHRVTEIDLFYLYCIYSDEVVCNIPYWLAKYMVGMREKSLIWCFWPTTREAVEEDEEDDEGDEATGGDAGHEGARGFADMYRNMSQGDWQVRQARWMDQQDEQWGKLNNWMGQQDERTH
ncbi:hypothetical protein Tco_0133700 [Tanacetum coccineum]